MKTIQQVEKNPLSKKKKMRKKRNTEGPTDGKKGEEARGEIFHTPTDYGIILEEWDRRMKRSEAESTLGAKSVE